MVPESGQLKRKFKEAIDHRDGLTWGKKEVEETIVELVDNQMASHPNKRTIEASLGVIANCHGHTLGIWKGKKGHRGMADESERSMLAEVATQLVAQIIVDPDGIPAGYGLPDNAPESFQRGLEIYSQATGIPKENLYYSNYEGLVSTDDVGFIFE